jgi:hypothetical protein
MGDAEKAKSCTVHKNIISCSAQVFLILAAKFTVCVKLYLVNNEFVSSGCFH